MKAGHWTTTHPQSPHRQIQVQAAQGPEAYGRFASRHDSCRPRSSYGHRIPAHPCSKPWLASQNRVARKFHTSPQLTGQLSFKSGIFKKPDIAVELDQQVEIAVGTFLSAGARAEHPKLFGFVTPRDCVDFIPLRAYLVKHAHLQNIYIIPKNESAAQVPRPVSSDRAKARPFPGNYISESFLRRA